MLAVREDRLNDRKYSTIDVFEEELKQSYKALTKVELGISIDELILGEVSTSKAHLKVKEEKGKTKRSEGGMMKGAQRSSEGGRGREGVRGGEMTTVGGQEKGR